MLQKQIPNHLPLYGYRDEDKYMFSHFCFRLVTFQSLAKKGGPNKGFVETRLNTSKKNITFVFCKTNLCQLPHGPTCRTLDTAKTAHSTQSSRRKFRGRPNSRYSCWFAKGFGVLVSTHAPPQKKLLYFEWSPPWHFKTSTLAILVFWNFVWSCRVLPATHYSTCHKCLKKQATNMSVDDLSIFRQPTCQNMSVYHLAETFE